MIYIKYDDECYEYINSLKRSLQQNYMYYICNITNVKTSTNIETGILTNNFKLIYLDNTKINNDIKFKIDVQCENEYQIYCANCIKTIDGNSINGIIHPNMYLFTLSKKKYMLINGIIKKSPGRLIGNFGHRPVKLSNNKIRFNIKFNHYNIYPPKKLISIGFEKIYKSLSYFSKTYKSLLKKTRNNSYKCIFENSSDIKIEEIILSPISYEIIKKFKIEQNKLILFGNKKCYKDGPEHQIIIKCIDNNISNIHDMIDYSIDVCIKKFKNFERYIYANMKYK